MKKYLAAVVLMALVIGCAPEKKKKTLINWKSKCVTTEDKDKQARFLLDCIKNGNPMSDEEPEDLVSQCEQTSENVVCPQTCVKEVYMPDVGWSEYPCTEDDQQEKPF